MGEACLDILSHQAAFGVNLDSGITRYEHVDWYTLKVRAGGEMNAVAGLQYRGYSPYCPMHEVRRQYSDRMKVVNTAVFPGYVFCQFDAQHKLPIVSSPGVEYILGYSDGPTPVRDEELTNIRRMIEAGASPVRTVEPGQRVRVTHGPLAGVVGILVRDTTQNRLVVSIDLLKQGASLTISPDHVAPIEQN